jgi:hypothetical protein
MVVGISTIDITAFVAMDPMTRTKMIFTHTNQAVAAAAAVVPFYGERKS